MSKRKVAITLENRTVSRLDQLVQEERYPNRSQAIEAAIVEQLTRLDRTRLAEACAKLDPVAEQALAEELLELADEPWPEY